MVLWFPQTPDRSPGPDPQTRFALTAAFAKVDTTLRKNAFYAPSDEKTQRKEDVEPVLASGGRVLYHSQAVALTFVRFRQ